MSSREVFLAAAPLMYRAGWQTHSAEDKQKDEFIKNYGVVPLCLCSDHIAMSTGILRSLNSPRFRTGQKQMIIALVNHPPCCRDAEYFHFLCQKHSPGLVIPACSNLRQRCFQAPCIFMSVPPMRIGTCNFQMYPVPREVGAKTKNPSLRMFEHSNDLHGIFILDFHYTRFGLLVGWSTPCSTR